MNGTGNNVRAPAPATKQQQQQQLATFVTELNDHDVLMGRGSPSSEYSGNLAFRQLVIDRREDYLRCTRRNQKHGIAKEIIQAVIDRGGRFLQRITTLEEAEKLGVPPRVQAWRVLAPSSSLCIKVKQLMRDVGEETQKKRKIRREAKRREAKQQSSTESPAKRSKKEPPSNLEGSKAPVQVVQRQACKDNAQKKDADESSISSEEDENSSAHKGNSPCSSRNEEKKIKASRQANTGVVKTPIIAPPTMAVSQRAPEVHTAALSAVAPTVPTNPMQSNTAGLAQPAHAMQSNTAGLAQDSPTQQLAMLLNAWTQQQQIQQQIQQQQLQLQMLSQIPPTDLIALLLLGNNNEASAVPAIPPPPPPPPPPQAPTLQDLLQSAILSQQPAANQRVAANPGNPVHNSRNELELLALLLNAQQQQPPPSSHPPPPPPPPSG